MAETAQADRRARLILLADNDTRSLRFATRCLQGTGFHVLHAHDAEELLTTETMEAPTAVVVAHELPGSLDAVRHLRQASDVPIIFMTLANEIGAAAALRGGADAILLKPFAADLLIAYVDAVIRRAQSQGGHVARQTYSCGDLSADFSARAVIVRGVRIHLSVREYSLLKVLTANAGSVLTHDQLLWLVWGPGYEGNSDLLRGYVHRLRAKIGDDARHPHLIRTENQVGYWMLPSEGG